MTGLKVVVADATFPTYDIERSIFEPLGVTFEVHDAKTPEAVLRVARDADVLMVGWASVTREVIGALERCRGVVRYGVGYELIDAEAAAELGIPVANVPDYCTAEVADQALAFILTLTRKLHLVRAQLRAGTWQGAPFRPIHELQSLRLGLLGIGRIGRAVIERARPFGFAIQAHDPFAGDDVFTELGIDRVDHTTLLQTSNVLSLHVPLTPATRHVIDAEALARMPAGAYLVNVSRGGLVDEEALADALRSGHTAGAAMDVFEREPVAPDSPLLPLDTFIGTSHYAWYSEEAFERLQRFAALEAARLLKGELPRNVVNRVERPLVRP